MEQNFLINEISPNQHLAPVFMKKYFSFRSAKYYLGISKVALAKIINKKILKIHKVKRGNKNYRFMLVSDVKKLYSENFKKCCDINEFSEKTGFSIGELMMLHHTRCLRKKMILGEMFYYENSLINEVQKNRNNFILVDLMYEFKNTLNYNSVAMSRIIFYMRRTKMFPYYTFQDKIYTTRQTIIDLQEKKIKIPSVDVFKFRSGIINKLGITDFDFNKLCKDFEIEPKKFKISPRKKILAYDLDDFKNLKEIIKKKYTSTNPFLLFLRKNENLEKTKYAIKYNDEFFIKIIMDIPVRMDRVFYPTLTSFFKIKQNPLVTEDYYTNEINDKNKILRQFHKFSPEHLKSIVSIEKSGILLLKITAENYKEIAPLFGGVIGAYKNSKYMYSIDRKYGSIKLKQIKENIVYSDFEIGKLNGILIDKIVRQYFKRKFKQLSLFEDNNNYKLYIDNSIFILRKIKPRNYCDEQFIGKISNLIEQTNKINFKIKIEPETFLTNIESNVKSAGKEISQVKRLTPFIFKYDNGDFIKYILKASDSDKFISLTHIIAIRNRCKYLTVNREFDSNTVKGAKNVNFITVTKKINILQINETLFSLYTLKTFFQNNRIANVNEIKKEWDRLLTYELKNLTENNEIIN